MLLAFAPPSERGLSPFPGHDCSHIPAPSVGVLQLVGLRGSVLQRVTNAAFLMSGAIPGFATWQHNRRLACWWAVVTLLALALNVEVRL